MTRPRFASALSTDPESSTAEERCLAAVKVQLEGARPDLAVVFASHHHGDVLDGWTRRLREQLGARHLIGCTGTGIAGGDQEVEQRPALSLWAASMPDTELVPQVLGARPDGEESWSFSADLELTDPSRAGTLLFSDPYSFPVSSYLDQQGERWPGLPVAGGLASGGMGPGQNLLFLDDQVLQQGAVAITIEGAVQMCTAVSQGCRPVASPMVITACRENVILKLRGKKAAKVLLSTLEELPDEERDLFRRGSFLGIALDPTKSSFDPGDLLVRNVMGLYPQEDAIAIGDDSIRVGQTVQFMVRDAASASVELEQVLTARARDWQAPPGESGALLFTCSGRGSRMFEAAHHDAGKVQEILGPDLPLAGFFANGELGPVAGRNFVHGFTASVAHFRQRASAPLHPGHS